MSAGDHLSGQQFGQNEVHGQLPMFMTGREIIRGTEPGDAMGMGDHGRMWRSKLNDLGNLPQQIAHAGGVREPVAISAHPLFGMHTKPTLVNGHHRTISEAVNAPKRLLPVVHVTDYDDPDSFRDKST